MKSFKIFSFSIFLIISFAKLSPLIAQEKNVVLESDEGLEKKTNIKPTYPGPRAPDYGLTPGGMPFVPGKNGGKSSQGISTLPPSTSPFPPGSPPPGGGFQLQPPGLPPSPPPGQTPGGGGGSSTPGQSTGSGAPTSPVTAPEPTPVQPPGQVTPPGPSPIPSPGENSGFPPPVSGGPPRSTETPPSSSSPPPPLPIAGEDGSSQPPSKGGPNQGAPTNLQNNQQKKWLNLMQKIFNGLNNNRSTTIKQISSTVFTSETIPPNPVIVPPPNT